MNPQTAALVLDYYIRQIDSTRWTALYGALDQVRTIEGVEAQVEAFNTAMGELRAQWIGVLKAARVELAAEGIFMKPIETPSHIVALLAAGGKVLRVRLDRPDVAGTLGALSAPRGNVGDDYSIFVFRTFDPYNLENPYWGEQEPVRAGLVRQGIMTAMLPVLNRCLPFPLAVVDTAASVGAGKLPGDCLKYRDPSSGKGSSIRVTEFDEDAVSVFSQHLGELKLEAMKPAVK